MSQANPSGQPPAAPRLSEDWLATIIGLAIVLVIGLGLIGPGPQNVTITAPAGETVGKEVVSLRGWQVSATLGGESSTIDNAWTDLENGESYVYSCRNGALFAGSIHDMLTVAPEDRAQVIVANDCDEEVVITQRTSPAIPWPVFGLFGR